MKKLFIFVLFLTFLISLTPLHAETYPYYQEIYFENKDVKLIEKWDDKTTKEYLKKINKKKWFGWNVYYVTTGEKFSYVANTVLDVKNTGTTPIVQKFTYKESDESKIQLSTSGQLKVDFSGPIKKFKFGLDAQIKISYDYTTSMKTSEELVTNINIDPGTRLIVKVIGEGKIYQGVANKYFFFIKTKEGAFEEVINTTEYYTIEKYPIDTKVSSETIYDYIGLDGREGKIIINEDGTYVIIY